MFYSNVILHQATPSIGPEYKRKSSFSLSAFIRRYKRKLMILVTTMGAFHKTIAQNVIHHSVEYIK